MDSLTASTKGQFEPIIGEPGAVSGGRKESKRARKNSGEKNSQERKEGRPTNFPCVLNPAIQKALNATFGVVLLDGTSSAIASKMATSIEIPLRDTEDEVEISLHSFIKRYFLIESKNFVFLIR